MARSFNGSSQYGLASSPVTSGGSYTLSQWVILSSLPSGPATSYSIDDSTTNRNHAQIAFEYTGQIAGQVYTNATNNYLTLGSTLSTGVWYHLAMTIASNGAWTLYIDGTSNCSNAGGAGFTGSVPNLRVAGFSNSSSTIQYFPGIIAETALWNAILSTGEISGLAAGSRANRIRPGSLQAYIPMFGLSSPEPDLSGNQRNLTFTGSPSQANHAPVTTFTRKAVTPGLSPSRLPYPVLISNPGPQYAWYE